MTTKATGTTTTALGADVYKLPTELPSYDEGIRAKIKDLDAPCNTSLAALELVAKDTANELEGVVVVVNLSKATVAVRFGKVARTIADIGAGSQREPPPLLQAKGELPAREPRRSIDPLTGQWFGVAQGAPTAPQPHPSNITWVLLQRTERLRG